MILLKNISRAFDSQILNNINYEFKTGNIYILKGISGSGKTTLLNILSGLDRNYDGEYYFQNRDVKKIVSQGDFSNNFNYIFQESLLIQNMTILENLLFIRDDKIKIEKLSEQFGVSNLLNKYPNQISGGERQRFALIRALLFDSSIILADEPTSSLDLKNSISFVEEIKKLKSKNKIIIIATHKDIYDSIADVVLQMEYGKLVEVSNQSSNELILEESIDESPVKNKYDRLYIQKKRKKNIGSIISITLLLIIISLSVIFAFNYNHIYFNQTISQYPYQVISMNSQQLKNMEQNIETIYYNYQLMEEEYMVLSLFPKQDSNFKIPNVISNGEFPTKENEVLVNDAFVKIKFPNMSFEEVIGKEILLDDQNFMISGIVTHQDTNSFYCYHSNIYYQKIYNSETQEVYPAVFINYNIMKQIGNKNDGDQLMVSLKLNKTRMLYTKDLDYDYLWGSTYLIWKNDLDNQVSSLSYISCIGLIVIIVAALIGAIFIENQINLDLFYRKREIGYLQLFRVNKKRVRKLIINEYMYNVLIGIIFAFILFIGTCSILYIKFNFNLFSSIYWFVIISITMILYSIIVIILPLAKYMKMDILSLIRKY